MADEQRLTKKERRARAREERKRQEAEAARKRRLAMLRNGAITVVAVVLVTLVILQATTGGPDTIEDPILISAAEVDEARAAAGCEVLAEREPVEEASHLEREQIAQMADTAYPVRPTHSGPHVVQPHPDVLGGASSQIDEFSSTHNLEHGGIIAWYDPEQVDGDTVGEMEDWAQRLNASGFDGSGGAVIFVSPYEDPGFSSGKAIGFRAWGTAIDCDEWDETVADGFAAEFYGTNGGAPEAGNFAPHPGTIQLRDDAPDDADAGDGESDDADGDEG